MEISEELYDDSWRLNSQKVAYLPKHKVMLIADLHIGKLTHFRNAGIAIPTDGEYTNFTRLQSLIDTYRPKKVVFLGDLFHSKESKTWEGFRLFLHNNDTLSFVLVLGNHDVFIDQQFQSEKNFKIIKNCLIGNYILTHEPLDKSKIEEGLVNVCGHIHPAVLLHGKGRQKLRINCFHFGRNQVVMPAFGEFTGSFIMDTSKGDIIVGVTNDEIFRIN